MASKHIPIDTWLEALGMKEYEGVFRDFHGVEVGLHILKKDIGLTLFQIVEIFPMSYHKVYLIFYQLLALSVWEASKHCRHLI